MTTNRIDGAIWLMEHIPQQKLPDNYFVLQFEHTQDKNIFLEWYARHGEREFKKWRKRK